MLVKAATEYPTLEETMNAFYQHPKHNIAFHYRCFDRFLLNAAIQPFQQPERVMGFFWSYRQLYPGSRKVLRDIASPYHNWSSTPRASGELRSRKRRKRNAGISSWTLISGTPARPDRGHSQSPRARSHPAPYR